MEQLSLGEPEIWLSVVGYDGYYEVSSLGQVRSLTRRLRSGVLHKGRVLRPAKANAYGHLHVELWADGAHESRLVHHLVLEAFVGPRPEGLETRHLDGNPANNRLGNLLYGTPSENQRDRLLHGTHNHGNKTHCDNGHEFTPSNTLIVHWPDGSFKQRQCRACHQLVSRESARRRRRARRAAA